MKSPRDHLFCCYYIVNIIVLISRLSSTTTTHAFTFRVERTRFPHRKVIIGHHPSQQHLHHQQQQQNQQSWHRSPTVTSLAVTQSWKDIETMFGTTWTSSTPIDIDSVLDTKKPKFSNERPTLFRERHGWCPYSERAWLTLELLNIEYDTVRIDNTGHGARPSYYAGNTPQMKWPNNGKVQSESYDLVVALDKEYGNIQLGGDSDDLNNIVNQFSNIFPRARPSSRAAYLFQYNGEPLSRSTFEETLEQTDELLSSSSSSDGGGGGPFFGGSNVVTVADIAWAPFLERYRYQLPCLHEGLRPDNAQFYPHLAAWYQAMDDQVPAYACRVKGDASSWRKVLTMAGFGNAGSPPPQIMDQMQQLAKEEAKNTVSCIRQDLWDMYATKSSDRPYLAATPAAEAGLIITRNRDAILRDIVKQSSRQNNNDLPIDSMDELDELLRDLVLILVESKISSGKDKEGEAGSTVVEWDMTMVKDPQMIGKLASFLDKRMCVPRDMGAMSAACIKDLAWKLEK